MGWGYDSCWLLVVVMVVTVVLAVVRNGQSVKKCIRLYMPSMLHLHLL